MVATADLFAKAQKHHQGQRFAEAERIYRQIVEGEPSHVQHGTILASYFFIAQDKLKEAADGFQQVLTLAPIMWRGSRELGIVFAKQHRLPEAVAKFPARHRASARARQGP